MKRIFLLKGLDCPNCSAKIEKEVGELDGVQSSVVNLMKQTLTINVTQTAADTIARQIETIVHSHEPDVEVQEETVMNVTKSYLLKGLILSFQLCHITCGINYLLQDFLHSQHICLAFQHLYKSYKAIDL